MARKAFRCADHCRDYETCKEMCDVIAAQLPSPRRGCSRQVLGNQLIENTSLSDALEWGISPLQDAINDISDRTLKAVIGLRLVRLSYTDISELLGMSKTSIAALLKGGFVRRGKRVSGVPQDQDTPPDKSNT
jgi:DNA-directed RNA polymerase specialized sigma24 family protein